MCLSLLFSSFFLFFSFFFSFSLPFFQVFTPATGQTISIPIDPPSNLLQVYVHRNFLEAAVEATAAARSPWQPGGFEYSQEVRRLIEDCTRGDEEVRKKRDEKEEEEKVKEEIEEK